MVAELAPTSSRVVYCARCGEPRTSGDQCKPCRRVRFAKLKRSRPRERLQAARFRRIWQIVEEIASHPGLTRRILADKFHLSERMVQTDLNLIGGAMGLPLVRRQGYRFMAEGAVPSGPAGLTTADALLLMDLLGDRVRQVRGARREAIRALMGRLSSLFPPHLAPMAAAMMASCYADATGNRAVPFQSVARAILDGSTLRLTYQFGAQPFDGAREVTIRPDIVVPYLRGWYAIGYSASRSREVMVLLDGIESVAVDDDS